MSKALITVGAKTSHGGMVTESESSFLINGMAVHLNGMTHYCPKGQTTATAIASDLSTIVQGRAVIIAGDKTRCGATFLPMQNLTISSK